MSFKTKKIFQNSNFTALNLPFTDWNFPIVGNTDSRLVQLNSNVVWQHFSSVKTAMQIFPFRTELRTMHSYKAVSKRKWQRRRCWRSSFFTHLQTLSPFYFTPSFVRLTYFVNPLKPELNSICYLLALLAHHFLHDSRIRVKSLTLRWLMSYIYIYIYIYIWSTHSWCF